MRNLTGGRGRGSSRHARDSGCEPRGDADNAPRNRDHEERNSFGGGGCSAVVVLERPYDKPSR